MAPNNQGLDDVRATLSMLRDLHRWELDNIPILRTMTGRDVYLTLASSLDDESGGVSLKALKNNNYYTDKAIANRLEMLQKMQMIKKSKTATDGRVKIIMPDDQLHDYCEKHSMAFFQIVNKYFTLIKK